MDYPNTSNLFLTIIFFLGLSILLLGASFAIRSAAYYSGVFKISKFFIGLILVSFATSAPELFITLESSLKDYNDISIGNILGSNITNLCLVMGICGIFSRVEYRERKSFFLNVLFMFLGGLLLGLFLIIDNRLDRLDGLALLIIFLIFMYFFLIKFNRNKKTIEYNYSDEKLKHSNKRKALAKYTIIFLLGILFLYIGSNLIIDTAVEFSNRTGLESRIISLTVISIGTSLPELVTSLMAIFKKEHGLYLGSLVGSNIFNTYVIIGLASLVAPINELDIKTLNFDIPYMLGVYLLLIISIFVAKNNIIKKRQILLHLIFYFLFLLFIF